jgi:hypothetical protein
VNSTGQLYLLAGIGCFAFALVCQNAVRAIVAAPSQPLVSVQPGAVSNAVQTAETAPVSRDQVLTERWRKHRDQTTS